MLRSDLEAEVGRLLGDPNNTRWTTPVIDLRLDAAQIDVQKWTNAIKTTTNYTPVASISTVQVGASVIDILRATFTTPSGTIKNDKTGFRPISRWDLDFNRPNWQNESQGEPELWTFDASNQNVILVPAPDASNATANALTLLEVRQPTALSSGSAASVPFDNNNLMVPYHRALCYWAVSECMKDNNDSDSLNKAKYFRSNDISRPGEYEKEIKQILMKFDVPEAIPAQVLFQPTGGRVGGVGWPSKRYPFLP